VKRLRVIYDIDPKETRSVKVVVGTCPFGIISQFLLTGAR
jgi:hypothetical protein